MEEFTINYISPLIGVIIGIYIYTLITYPFRKKK